jgi:hypothetical protein
MKKIFSSATNNLRHVRFATFVSSLEKEKQNPDFYDYLGRARSDSAETIADPQRPESLYLQAIEDFEKSSAPCSIGKDLPARARLRI